MKEIPFNLITGIIHIGAHAGEEAGLYHKKEVKRVLWFEPNPKAYSALKDNLKKYKTQFAVNAGISQQEGKMTLHIASNSWSSSFLPLKEHAVEYPDIYYTESIEVDTMRGDSIKDLHLYNTINIDVQGYELVALKSFGDKIKDFRYIYAEVNFKEMYDGCVLIGDLDKYLAGYGFTRKATTDTQKGWGDALYENNSYNPVS